MRRELSLLEYMCLPGPMVIKLRPIPLPASYFTPLYIDAAEWEILIACRMFKRMTALRLF